MIGGKDSLIDRESDYLNNIFKKNYMDIDLKKMTNHSNFQTNSFSQSKIIFFFYNLNR